MEQGGRGRWQRRRSSSSGALRHASRARISSSVAAAMNGRRGRDVVEDLKPPTCQVRTAAWARGVFWVCGRRPDGSAACMPSACGSASRASRAAAVAGPRSRGACRSCRTSMSLSTSASMPRRMPSGPSPRARLLPPAGAVQASCGCCVDLRLSGTAGGRIWGWEPIGHVPSAMTVSGQSGLRTDAEASRRRADVCTSASGNVERMRLQGGLRAAGHGQDHRQTCFPNRR